MQEARELVGLLSQLSQSTGKRETHLWNFLESSPAVGNPSAVSAHLPSGGRKVDRWPRGLNPCTSYL